jgi:predicted metal-dependent hydrolase
VHVAVAWYQAGRGNRVGCERQLAKAARRLGPYAPSHRGVDVASVLAQVEAAAARVAAGTLDLDAPRL